MRYFHHQAGEATEMKITTVGIDLAKNVFQAHGVDERGKAVLRKPLKREQVAPFFANLPPCLIGMEACGSAHHWARKLEAFGHTVKLMAPQFVKPYVKTNKNDAADAEAICEAVGRPNMRFVPIKNGEQHAVLAMHRARQGFVKARTAQANQIRGLLAEYGIIIPQGIGHIAKRLPDVLEDGENGLPGTFRQLLDRLGDHLKELDRQVGELEVQIQVWHRENKASKKLAQIPGIGPITASALVASSWGCEEFRERTAAVGLAGIGPQATLQWRQAVASGHQQARRYLFAHTADPRCSGGDTGSRAQGELCAKLAGAADRPAQQKRRGSGLGEQERPHRLGAAGLRARLPARL
jgi:transposase